MDAHKGLAPVFPVLLTPKQSDFLLYTLGYMLAAADRMDDGHKFYIQEHHYAILPKLHGADQGMKDELVGLAEKATHICCLAQVPGVPQHVEIVRLAAEISNVLAVFRINNQ
jgi:hypothetical protein